MLGKYYLSGVWFDGYFKNWGEVDSFIEFCDTEFGECVNVKITKENATVYDIYNSTLEDLYKIEIIAEMVGLDLHKKISELEEELIKMRLW